MKIVVISIIKAYRKIISPLKLSSTCRFTPTCSLYAIKSIEKYGVIKGCALSFIRIIKCNPFHPGGYDPV